MKHKAQLLILGALLLSAVAWYRGTVRSKPDILLLSIDTLRPDHLGCYGYVRSTSPSIDIFRMDSILFENVISAAPSTLPAHATLFTSLYPQHHGASHTRARPLPEGVVTIAEVLRDAGYETVGLTGGGQLSSVFGIGQGFEEFRQAEERADEIPGSFYQIVNSAIEVLQRKRTKPLFLFLHTYEVHHPYIPRQDLYTQVSGLSGRNLPRIEAEYLFEINTSQVSLTHNQKQEIIDSYDAEVRSMDASFGKLVDYLKQRALYDDLVIILTSDHGEEFGEHGWMGWHSHTLFQELLRIPLLIKLPKQKDRGTTVEFSVRSVDIAPTILEIAAIPVPSQFEGEPLLAALRSGDFVEKPAVFWRETMPYENGAFEGIQFQEWKLASGQLFDLSGDSKELRNVASSFSFRRARLEESLNTVLKQRPRLRSDRIVIDEQTLESLRALGYVN